MTERLAKFEAQPLWRVVPTRLPPIALFERAASLEDGEELIRLEGAFNPHHGAHMRTEGPPSSQWVFGPGAGYVMAPFVYPNPSRFSDGSYGVFYGGLEEATAIQEVAFHRRRFMEATGQGPMMLECLLLQAACSATLADIRHLREQLPLVYDPDPNCYAPAQAYALALRTGGSAGITYASVRASGGECAALFIPKALAHCKVLRPLHYLWNGRQIAGWG